MQDSRAGADARTVIRLLAIAAAAAFLLSGCSTEEGNRAQDLLQQAEQAQADLHSATFEASVGFQMQGKQVDLTLKGAASKEGATSRCARPASPKQPARTFGWSSAATAPG